MRTSQRENLTHDRARVMVSSASSASMPAVPLSFLPDLSPPPPPLAPVAAARRARDRISTAARVVPVLIRVSKLRIMEPSALRNAAESPLSSA